VSEPTMSITMKHYRELLEKIVEKDAEIERLKDEVAGHRYTITWLEETEMALQKGIAEMKAEIASLKAQLAAMTEDRNLWQQEAGGFSGKESE
jgi:phage shock protein A